MGFADNKENVEYHSAYLLKCEFVTECTRDSPLLTERHLYNCALFCQLTGENVSMDIYMMLLYILHCTGTFCLRKGGAMWCSIETLSKCFKNTVLCLCQIWICDFFSCSVLYNQYSCFTIKNLFLWMYFMHMYFSSCEPLAVLWQCD